MKEERREANERVKNTLIRNLPSDKYENDVIAAEESDLSGYNIHLQLERLNTENPRGQIKEILNETNPHLYNRTHYIANVVRINNPWGLEVHIKMVSAKKRE